MKRVKLLKKNQQDLPTFTTKQLCFLCDCTPMAITHAAKDGTIVKLGRDRYAPVSVPNLVRSLRQRRGGTDEFHAARTRKLVEQARALEHARLLRDGKYARVEEIDAEFERILYATKAKLLAVPNRFASLARRTLGDDAKLAALADTVKKLIREALTDLSNTRVEDGTLVKDRRHLEAAE